MCRGSRLQLLPFPPSAGAGRGPVPLYDGVTEAVNARDTAFSDERLERSLSALHGSVISEIVNGVMAEVRRFTEEAPQSDDMTMMIHYKGKQRGQTASIVFPEIFYEHLQRGG